MINYKKAYLQQLGPFKISLWINSRGQHQLYNLWMLRYFMQMSKGQLQEARKRDDSESIRFVFKHNIPFPQVMLFT